MRQRRDAVVGSDRVGCWGGGWRSGENPIPLGNGTMSVMASLFDLRPRNAQSHQFG